VKRPTDKYDMNRGMTLQGFFARVALVVVTVAIIAGVAGWTRGLRAADDVALPNVDLVAKRMGSLSEQLEASRGELSLAQVQLERANAVMEASARYQIPADLAGAIYDIALSEGIDPALGFRLVKIESGFKAGARSPMAALGYTQVQLATARHYAGDMTERKLMDRDVNLRIGFRFLKDLMGRFEGDTHLALLAYNRGPARVAEILAQGGDPTNGYSAAVLKGYRPPRSVTGGSH